MSTFVHPQGRLSSITQSFSGTCVALLISFSPKCPLCWAAYLSFFGLSGASALFVNTWILPLLIGLFLIHLTAIGRRAFRRRRFLPLILSGSGFLTMLACYHWQLPDLRAPGLLLVLGGSLSSAFSQKTSQPACSCQG